MNDLAEIERWVSEHPHPERPESRVQLYAGDWAKIVAALRSNEAVQPMDLSKLPDSFLGVVWFRDDGIYTMGEHGWEKYSPPAPNGA